MGYVMASLLKNAIYILVTIAVSFVIGKYLLKVDITLEWLAGALFIPLLFIVLSSEPEPESEKDNG